MSAYGSTDQPCIALRKRRGGSGRGWALLPGLDRQHRRELAWSFASEYPTCFATEDRVERDDVSDGSSWRQLEPTSNQARFFLVRR